MERVQVAVPTSGEHALEVWEAIGAKALWRARGELLVIPLYIMVCMDVWSKMIPILVYLTAGTRRTRPIHTHDRYTHDFTERSPM